MSLTPIQTLADAITCGGDRFTMEHAPAHASTKLSNGMYPAPGYKTDEEWFKLSKFTSDAERFAKGIMYCSWTAPSYPLGQYLPMPYVVPANEQIEDAYKDAMARVAEYRRILSDIRNDPRLTQDVRNERVSRYLSEWRANNIYPE